MEKGDEGRGNQEEGRMTGDEGSMVREPKQCADQFQSDSAREASLLCCCEDGDGSQTVGGEGAEPRGKEGNFSLLGISPSTSSENSTTG